MGQYYVIACIPEGNKRVNVYEPDSGNKLMEFSYLNNFTLDGICFELYKKPHYVGFVGDYTEDTDDFYGEGSSYQYKDKLTGKKVWSKHAYSIDSTDMFDYTGKYLVNLDTKEYISFDEYRKTVAYIQNEDDYITHPLAILTCSTNGKGGGDYSGINMDNVGIWSMCLLTITDKEPEGFTNRKDLIFCENIVNDPNHEGMIVLHNV